jgi:hypothetical protein
MIAYHIIIIFYHSTKNICIEFSNFHRSSSSVQYISLQFTNSNVDPTKNCVINKIRKIRANNSVTNNLIRNCIYYITRNLVYSITHDIRYIRLSIRVYVIMFIVHTADMNAHGQQI